MKETSEPKLRKQREVWKINFNKYFREIMFLSGIGIIIVSIICRWYGVDGIWLISVSLMENIGAVFLVPPIIDWLKRVVSWGLRPNRPPIEVYLLPMKSDLRMLGISLHDIYENPQDFNECLKKIFSKDKGPFRFKFLLMNPNSRFLKLRAKEEGKPLIKFYEEIKNTLKELERIKDTAKSEEKVEYFKIYVYDAPATHSLIWVDERMHVGPYLRRQAGYETFWIDTSSEEEAYKDLEQDFNQLLGEPSTKELTEDDLKKMIEELTKLIENKEGENNLQKESETREDFEK